MSPLSPAGALAGWRNNKVPHPIIPFPECVTGHQGTVSCFSDTAAFTATPHPGNVTLDGRHYFTKLTCWPFSKRFRAYAIFNRPVLFEFNASVDLFSGVPSCLSFLKIPPLPLAFNFLISRLFLYIDCNVRLLFVVSFLPTFNLSVMF